MRYSRNQDIDMNSNGLYNLVVGNKEHFDDVKNKNNNVTPKQESIYSTLVMIIFLLIIVGGLMYLTFTRYYMATDSLYKGNNLAGFAMLSPEIGNLVRMGLGI
jgi:ATP-dependent Zn protease